MHERRLTYFVQYLPTMMDGAWCCICLRVLKASESFRVSYHNDNITIPLIYQISSVKRKRPCFIIEKKNCVLFLGDLSYTRGFFSIKGRLVLPTFCH